MSDNENRINYYLGSLVKLETIPEQDKQKLVHLSHYNNTIKVWKDIYVSKLYELLVNVYGEEEAKHKKLLLQLGDVVDHDDQLKYSFTKITTITFWKAFIMKFSSFNEFSIISFINKKTS